MTKKAPKPAESLAQQSNSDLTKQPTFMEHVSELRGRLFWVIGVFIAASCAVYPLHDQVIGALTAPLGDQQLYYLTPVGGLTIILKICTYVGILAALPVLMYHVYRYLEPLMGRHRKSVMFYTLLSALLAIAGICMAYYVFLPSALHFLTGFDLGKIQAMLTVDSYLSFVTTYLLGAAILFQIPLLMMIINTIHRLPPKQLLGLERFVILAAFVIAAVVSPTPDIMNQTFFALPIIGRYQLGVGLVWWQQRQEAKLPAVSTRADDIPQDVLLDLTNRDLFAARPVAPVTHVASAQHRPAPMDISPAHRPTRRQTAKPGSSTRSIDGFTPRSTLEAQT